MPEFIIHHLMNTAKTVNSSTQAFTRKTTARSVLGELRISASMDELHLNMESPLVKQGELRCSDLDMPLITSDYLEPRITKLMSTMQNQEWMMMLDGKADLEKYTLLTHMCHCILEVITNVVLDTVVPQVHNRMEIDQEGVSNFSNTSVMRNGINIAYRERNYYRVTEDDIQASLGNSFDECFGATLKSEQKRSHHTKKLLELTATEVMKRVNHVLERITGSSSETSNAPYIKDMVYCVVHILRECLGLNTHPATQEGPEQLNTAEDQECWDSDESEDVSPEQLETAEDQEDLDSNFCEGSSPNQEMDIEQLNTKDAGTTLSLTESSEHSVCQIVEPTVSSAEELPQREKTFYVVFLGQLVDYISQSTETSIYDVDFDRMLERVRERTVGSVTLPQTVGNIHIPIYEKLCHQFGSAKLMQAAMVSGDVAFDEAVARTLKAQLWKTSGPPVSFGIKLKRFFSRRSRKVAPATENNPMVSHSEVINQDKNSTPPPQRKQKRPAIVRMFSSVARILRKPFACCVSAE